MGLDFPAAARILAGKVENLVGFWLINCEKVYCPLQKKNHPYFSSFIFLASISFLKMISGYSKTAHFAPLWKHQLFC